MDVAVHVRSKLALLLALTVSRELVLAFLLTLLLSFNTIFKIPFIRSSYLAKPTDKFIKLQEEERA